MENDRIFCLKMTLDQSMIEKKNSKNLNLVSYPHVNAYCSDNILIYKRPEKLIWKKQHNDLQLIDISPQICIRYCQSRS